jgi:hypothetical protein
MTVNIYFISNFKHNEIILFINFTYLKNYIHYLIFIVLEFHPRGKNGNLHAKNLIPGSIARRANVAKKSS